MRKLYYFDIGKIIKKREEIYFKSSVILLTKACVFCVIHKIKKKKFRLAYAKNKFLYLTIFSWKSLSQDEHQRWNLLPQTMFYRIICGAPKFKLQVSHERASWSIYDNSINTPGKKCQEEGTSWCGFKKTPTM